jgi:hypothetical protein
MIARTKKRGNSKGSGVILWHDQRVFRLLREIAKRGIPGTP